MSSETRKLDRKGTWGTLRSARRPSQWPNIRPSFNRVLKDRLGEYMRAESASSSGVT